MPGGFDMAKKIIAVIHDFFFLWVLGRSVLTFEQWRLDLGSSRRS